MRRIFAVAALALGFAQAHAAVTITMIDLPLPGNPRILDVRPDHPIATLVAIPGGVGVWGITGNALPGGLAGACGPIARTSTLYTDRGYAIVLIDRQDADVNAVLNWLWTRDALPMWIVGVSSSTGVAAAAAATLPASVPMGALFLAATPVSPAVAQSIKRPAQVVYHVDDTISNVAAPALYADLTSAAARELVPMAGGFAGGECNGYHLMVGLENDLVAVTHAFIVKNAGLLGGPTVAQAVPVVEYFNASQGHYFMTADADEIAGLDGGAFGGALLRTGLGFNAWNAPSAGTVPVCRFFTTPGRFGTKGSHFYTANAAECEWLKGSPDWIYEKIAFHIQVPAAGACPAGTASIYRMFNHGQTGAPNHRFTTDLALYEDFVATKGWDAEGIAFCSPP